MWWNSTLLAIVAELERIDTLLLTDRAETICDVGEMRERILYLFCWSTAKQTSVVPTKRLDGKKIIKENYSEYKDLFKILL